MPTDRTHQIFARLAYAWVPRDCCEATTLILNLLDLFYWPSDREMWYCIWPDQTRYLAKIDLSSHPEQDITTTPAGSTTSPQEARATPKESIDPRPSTNTSPPTPAALAAPYPLIDLINTILHNLIYHRLPSIYACYLPPLSRVLHFGTLPLPPITASTVLILHLLLIKHSFNHRHRLNTNLTQACILMMLRLLCSRFFRLTGGHLYFLGSISAVIGKEFRRGKWFSWECILRNWWMEYVSWWKTWILSSIPRAWQIISCVDEWIV